MRKRTKLVFGAIVALIVVVAVIMVVGNSSSNDTGIGELESFQRKSIQTKSSVQGPGLVSDELSAPLQEMSEVGTSAVSNVDKQAQNRMIIRSGILSIITKDVRKSVEDVSTYIATVGGYVVNSSIEGTADAPSATIEVRVPVDKFSQAIDSIKKTGIRVTDESTSGEDVTEDYTDTQSRIKNLQASEAQFQEIMKQAIKVSDVLEVQRQLERVRGEIEVAQGHAQYLEKSAKLSTITAYFAIDEGELPVIDPINEWNPLTIIKSAFRAFVSIAQGIGTLIIWLIVFVPVWIVIAIVAIIIKKRAKKSTIVQSAPVLKK